jgi:carboxyl-terminal processing protease
MFLRIASLVAVLLACSACALVDPNNVIARHFGEATPMPTEVVPSPAPATLDRAARERAFDFVWNTIDKRYRDASFNGVDWKAAGERYRPLAIAAADDDAFWDVLDRMTGELHDSHTRVESPKRVALREKNEAITLGFSFLPIDGKLAVSAVHPESDAYWAGVRPGMAIVSIGGEPALQAYRKLLAGTRNDSTDRARRLRVVRQLVTGAEGTSESFTFERADGSRFDARLTRRRIEGHLREEHRLLPSGFGYLRFSQWTLGLTLRALAALQELKDAPGMVIDLRNNPGGSVHAVNALLDQFFPHRTELGGTTTRNGRPIALFLGSVEIIKLKRVAAGNPNAYRGPVVILTNAVSASGSELFAGTLQATGRARVVGQPSCGCLMGFLGYARIPGGGELAYSEVGFTLTNGKPVEGEGVIPDDPVAITFADLQVGRDRTLEEAQAMLKTMKPWTR